MVIEEQEGEAEPVGAVAAFGGKVQTIVRDVKVATTAGNRIIFWPLACLIGAAVLIVTGVAQEGWARGLAIVLLMLCAIWVVADEVGG